MPVPFAAETWIKRGDVPAIVITGLYSGPVSGVQTGHHDKPSGYTQVQSKIAHDTFNWFNTAQASFNQGASWTEIYRGDQLSSDVSEVVAGSFSLVTPDGTTLIYQWRWQLRHSFLIADGSLFKGGISLHISTNGTAFSKQQQLYDWGQVNADPVNTGGHAAFLTFPSLAAPIMIPGSGPANEDAYWMVVSYVLNYGGTNNDTTETVCDLWRSTDGVSWEIVRDMVPEFGGAPSLTYWFTSDSGRRFIAGVTEMLFTDDEDLITAAFTSSNLSGLAPFGTMNNMYGGTLLSNRNGTLGTEGFPFVSCDDGETFIHPLGVPQIAANANALIIKLGPTEAVMVAPDFINPTTETKAYYTSDGGETWLDGGVWTVSPIGERPIFAGLKSDGKPFVVSINSMFVSSDSARGVAGVRTTCPLANAGLAAARRLVLCGGVITPDCQE